MRRLSLIVALSACGGSRNTGTPETSNHGEHGGHEHGHTGGHHSFSDAEKWAKVFDDPARDAWQQPDEVIAALTLSPAMQVADIGAGTGYFTFRLARALPQGSVIATDIEPDMVRYLGERATKEKVNNVRAVLGKADEPGLDERSVDRILVVDVWHHVSDRVAFGKKLAAALRRGGQIAVVDFTLGASHGPPKEMRLAPEVIVDELNRAGLVARVAPTPLPEQYIVIGSLP